jgi:hypothetical protein
VRRGVVTAFRASAARDVLLRAGFLGWCAKRSGRGVLTDLMVRTIVCEGAAQSGIEGSNERVDDGRKNDGGRMPQLRGALGGIVVIMMGLMGTVAMFRVMIFGMGWPERFVTRYS